jgi:uncharacterized membrane protein YwzB
MKKHVDEYYLLACMPCSLMKGNRRFERKCGFNFQGRSIRAVLPVACSVYFSSLEMEGAASSETWIHIYQITGTTSQKTAILTERPKLYWDLSLLQTVALCVQTLCHLCCPLISWWRIWSRNPSRFVQNAKCSSGMILFHYHILSLCYRQQEADR